MILLICFVDVMPQQFPEMHLTTQLCRGGAAPHPCHSDSRILFKREESWPRIHGQGHMCIRAGAGSSAKVLYGVCPLADNKLNSCVLSQGARSADVVMRREGRNFWDRCQPDIGRGRGAIHPGGCRRHMHGGAPTACAEAGGAVVQALSEELQSMQQERHAHEADLERQRRDLQRKLVSAFAKNRAARVIQKGWSGYNAAKKKSASGKGKEKGKGKGKK